MQEVFENIIEKLEEEVLGKPTPEQFDSGIYKAIEIVKQVEAEYK